MARVEFLNLRLGSTSWITPGSFAENIKCASRHVGDVELVLFETEDLCNIPRASEVRELKKICDELDMSVTVHFARALSGSGDSTLCSKEEASCARIVELFSEMEPFAWILHLDGGAKFYGDALNKWKENVGGQVSRLATRIGETERLCVENLDYDLEKIEEVIESADTSICLDIGHLIRTGNVPGEKIKKFAKRTRVIHIHGVKTNGADHLDLSHLDPAVLRETVNAYAGDKRPRVMTIEVFEDDFFKSMNVIRSMDFEGSAKQ